MKTINVIEASATVREEGRKSRSGLVIANVVPGPDSWTLANATRDGANGDVEWTFDDVPLNPQATSPEFSLEKGKLYVFQLEAEVRRPAPFALVLTVAGGNPSDGKAWVRHRAMEHFGRVLVGFSFAPEKTGKFQLALINFFGAYDRGAALRCLSFSCFESAHSRDIETDEVATYLDHWGPVKRFIHRQCKRSRLFNAFVAGMEMRLNREESVSLPMYLALCPTGQCNALCDFCSVTIKRTGIIKKQLPFDKVQRFIAPTLNTAYMYGIEGNGEPTIYREFNSLLATLQKHGAAAYLITNGALIEPAQISHLLTLQSITFSLNAATPETHKKVMKLNEFDRVTDSIRAIVDQRGIDEKPSVFVSFVVHATNAHELQQFLAFAEYDLRVNVIMIRPLSELGADTGAVEDLREIVPYECQVTDALDAAREYLEDIPRRPIPHTRFNCDIRLDPTTFRSVRPDPVDRVVMPPGFEDRLLAPRRSGWHVLDERLSVTWRLSRATVHCPPNGISGGVWRSVSTPVVPNKTLTFRADIKLEGSPLSLSVVASDGQVLGSKLISPSCELQQIALVFDTVATDRVALELSHDGSGFTAEIDFFRLLTPGAGIRKAFKLPFPRRWQIDTPGVRARWTGNVLDISAGPNLAGRYLFKSYSNPCSPGSRLHLPLKLEVRSGALVIGILSEDFQRWTHQFSFEIGAHTKTLDIDTANNQRLQVVLFARGSDPLEARIDWGGTLEVPPERELGHPEEHFEVDMPRVDRELGDESAAARSPRPSNGSAPGKPKKIKFYCQKPWTDINNFTVDGRMDVCCIATGPSQEHYALGNILEQNFQEVWNGERMREFRRTVNSSDPLPPCQRCPMAYGYQGPFFDRQLADAALEQKFITSMAAQRPLRRLLAHVAHRSLTPIVKMFFKGFKQ